MTTEEQDKRRKKEQDLCILAHSIAEKAVGYGDVTYSEAIQILDYAKGIIETNMKKQRAAVPPEIRDRWGVIIGVSRTKVRDVADDWEVKRESDGG